MKIVIDGPAKEAEDGGGGYTLLHEVNSLPYPLSLLPAHNEEVAAALLVHVSSSDPPSLRGLTNLGLLPDLSKCAAEAWGTFLLVVFGIGSVSAAIFGNGNTQNGIWQVAVVWGWGVALSIYSTASISGAHLNPAVSLAFAITRPQR